MNYFYKRSNFYYLAIPIAAAIWVLVTLTILSGNANKSWGKNKKIYTKGQVEICKILAEDLDILKPEKSTNDKTEFDYGKVFTKFAGANSIPSSTWTHGTSPESKRKGKVTQTASLVINDIGVERLTRFLTGMLDTWPDLKCESLTLVKLKTGPDNWKIPELKFTYTF
ncbi:MAG: hypothetical protein FVQ79_08465 [Planctomycetes bacterium]|nr:hypothetical protein [Planctomycetota bacterium]